MRLLNIVKPVKYFELVDSINATKGAPGVFNAMILEGRVELLKNGEFKVDDGHRSDYLLRINVKNESEMNTLFTLFYYWARSMSVESYSVLSHSMIEEKCNNATNSLHLTLSYYRDEPVNDQYELYRLEHYAIRPHLIVGNKCITRGYIVNGNIISISFNGLVSEVDDDDKIEKIMNKDYDTYKDTLLKSV